MSSASQEILAAQRVRSSRNIFALVGIIIGLIPSTVIVLGYLPEGWDPKNVFLVFVVSGAVIGMLVHGAWSARQPSPACPTCGGSWEIIESGPKRNVDLLKPDGQCPHCGAGIDD